MIFPCHKVLHLETKFNPQLTVGVSGVSSTMSGRLAATSKGKSE